MARNFQALALRVPLGTTWEENWQLLQSPGGLPVDLTGYSARMMLRQDIEDAAPLATFTTGTEITITPAAGTVALRVEHTAVTALSPDNERLDGVWDIELFVPGTPNYVIPLFSGRFTLLPRVTR
jgi:hypothetical protein